MITSDSIQPEFRKLQRNLTALIDFSRHVNSNLDLDFTVNNLLLSCFGKFLTTKGMVALVREGTLQVVSAKGFNDSFTDAIKAVNEIKTEESRDAIKSLCLVNHFICHEITSSQQVLGFIILGEKINKQPYADDELEFLGTIINIAASAIQNALMIHDLKNVNRVLDSRINRLSSLFELSKEFGILTEEERIGKLLTYSMLGNFPTSALAALYIQENKVRVLQSTHPKKFFTDNLQIFDIQQISSPLMEAEIELLLPVLHNLKYKLAVPLVLQKETKGLLLLGGKLDRTPYTNEDVEFISSIAGLAVVSLENRRLFRDALEKQKMEEELEIAKGIQRNLLPKEIPQLEGYDIAAFTVPSKHVGGDYYDMIWLNEKEINFSIADVSGKGVPASLLMASLQAFLKSVCKQGFAIDTATNLINDLVVENTSDGRFITFFWGTLNPETRMFTYVNAGHNPPLLIRDSKIQYLDKGGIILGVMKTIMPYDADEVQLMKDDVLVLFTDGVTEAKDVKDDEYGDSRLEQFIINNQQLSAGEIIHELLHDMHDFVQGYPQSDDITIMVLKVN